MFRSTALLVGALIAGALSPLSTAAADSAPVRIYVSEYAEGQVLSHIAKQLIESRYDTPVELRQVAVGPAFLGVAHDQRALFLAAWLPQTHGAYIDRVGDDVDRIGELFDGARLGWAVPAHVPEDELASIADMADPAVRERLDSRIQGISAGAGLMQLSAEAVDAYGLDDYRLITASSAAMTAALAGAIEAGDWIVVTAWSPHWMWERFDLRYLDDPKNRLGDREHVDAIASDGFADREPAIHTMLERMHYSLDQINAMLVNAEANGYEVAARTFINSHPETIAEWTDPAPE